MIQFGMPTLAENRTLQDNIDLCARLGLRFIELNMNFPEYQVEELEKTDRLLEAADAAGIFYTVHLDENLPRCLLADLPAVFVAPGHLLAD